MKFIRLICIATSQSPSLLRTLTTANNLGMWYDMTDNMRDIILKFSQQVKMIMGSKLDKVILYGSYARGDYNEHSDVDIIILTTLIDEEIEKTESKE